MDIKTNDKAIDALAQKQSETLKALDDAMWKGEPCPNPDKGWITSRGKRITRLGNRNAFGKLIEAHNREIDYLRSIIIRAQPSETPVAEKVRDILMRFQSQIASSPIGRAGSDVLYTVKHNERDREELREALALLDAQAAPLEDCEKEIDLSGLMAGTHKVVPVEHDLTELKAAVEGMKRNPRAELMSRHSWSEQNAWDAALTAVADKIDEMIRRG